MKNEIESLFIELNSKYTKSMHRMCVMLGFLRGWKGIEGFRGLKKE